MHILITRPQGKGEALATQLQQSGYQVTLCPVLQLTDLEVSASELAVLQNADKVIFISQDAVQALHRLQPDINKAAQFYAVGQQTADAIYELFGKRAAVPKQHDSEGLLALTSLQSVTQQNIVLVKGEGGRTTLATTLKQREAFINQLNVYRREAVEGAADKWIDHWQSADIKGIVITSNAAVDAIFSATTARQREWLTQCQFYVASTRISEYLQQQQVTRTNIHIAAGASDDAMYACISQQGSKMSEQTEAQKNTAAKPADKTKSTIDANKTQTVTTKRSFSKSGSLALLISLIVASAVGYEFYHKLQTQQQSQLGFSELKSENQQLKSELSAIKQAQQTLQQALYNSEQKISAALQENSQEVEQQLSAALQRAQQQGNSLNPQEVTSIQRIAEFKLQAEHDYSGASAALSRLDSLLAEHPGTTELRQAIHQDLQTLKSLKPVATEAIYLKLHGVSEQLPQLAFNAVALPDEVEPEQQHQLSGDVSEWRQNLANTWHQMMDGFIKIRHRENAAMQPLLTEQERHLIKQRLQLYIAQAQDAILTKQASVYYSALDSARLLVSQYFQQNDNVTQSVQQALLELIDESLDFNPEVTLVSTSKVQEWAQ